MVEIYIQKRLKKNQHLIANLTLFIYLKDASSLFSLTEADSEAFFQRTDSRIYPIISSIIRYYLKLKTPKNSDVYKVLVEFDSLPVNNDAPKLQENPRP